MKKLYILFLLSTFLGHSQVGIGTTAPQGALDITSATNGMLVPRVLLSAINVSAPVVNPQGGALISGTLVWNTATAGVFPNNVIPGFYYWNGSIWISVTGAAANAWSLTGNGGINGGNITTAGTNFLGTTDAQNIDFRTNNNFVGRFSALGEFFVGTLNTTLPGDLMNAVGNTTFPWAVNGYTAFAGGAVYGGITGGSTNFAAVQGEYSGSGLNGNGVRGLSSSTASGSNFTNLVSAGVNGSYVVPTSRNYAFGVFGSVGNNAYIGSIRSGGVLGTDLFASGALGYYAANGNDYSVYGFGQTHTNGIATGRNSQDSTSINTLIGLGIYGGVIGGWIKGDEYGTVFSGDRFGNYTIGKTITNENFIVLSGKENKIATYASTSLNVDVNAKGIANLVNGNATVQFDKHFATLLSTEKPIIVTVTPIGQSNGLYLVSTDINGFTIKENNNGNSNISFTWIAIGEKSGYENPEISQEILDKNFEQNLTDLMHDETTDGGKAIWSENGNVKFGDKAPFQTVKETLSEDAKKLARDKTKSK